VKTFLSVARAARVLMLRTRIEGVRE
jgi:hypothetical protein